MTVAELIAQLQEHDPNMEVRLVYSYKDYWQTLVADNISSVNVGDINHCERLQCDEVCDSWSDLPDDAHEVVLLR